MPGGRILMSSGIARIPPVGPRPNLTQAVTSARNPGRRIYRSRGENDRLRVTCGAFRTSIRWGYSRSCERGRFRPIDPLVAGGGVHLNPRRHETRAAMLGATLAGEAKV